jgi:hypothetical protein
MTTNRSDRMPDRAPAASTIAFDGTTNRAARSCTRP